MRYTMTLSFSVIVVFWEGDVYISYSLPGSAGDHWWLLHSPQPPLSLGCIFNETTTDDYLAKA